MGTKLTDLLKLDMGDLADWIIANRDHYELVATKKEPELIQGYTAENWQEIIDGGYLCEFSNGALFIHSVSGVLFEHGFNIDEKEDYFCQEKDKTNEYRFCRPAQIKGVMRPIFVEPVDKGTKCLFVYDDDSQTIMTWGNFFSEGMTLERTLCEKYIEL